MSAKLFDISSLRLGSTISGELSKILPIHKNVDLSNFSRKSYINEYKENSLPRLKRLISLSGYLQSGNEKHVSLFIENTIEAIKTLKTGFNSNLYAEYINDTRQRCEKMNILSLNSELNGLLNVDIDVKKRMIDDFENEKNRIEGEIAVAKTNLIKDSIRNGLLELAYLYQRAGRLSFSLKTAIDSLDYCINDEMAIQSNLAIIYFAIELNQYPYVLNYISKTEKILGKNKSPLVRQQLSLSLGITHLETKKYDLAARAFIKAGEESIGKFDSLSVSDVTICGGLLSIAYLEREEIQNLLASSSFRVFFEHVPIIKEIIESFIKTDYRQCISLLEKLKPRLAINYIFSKHLQVVYDSILSRSIIQYVVPYDSLDLGKMANVFAMEQRILYSFISRLVSAGLINGRIDTERNAFFKKEQESREAAIQNAIKLSEDYEEIVHSLLFRINLGIHDIKQYSPNTSKQSEPIDFMEMDL